MIRSRLRRSDSRRSTLRPSHSRRARMFLRSMFRSRMALAAISMGLLLAGCGHQDRIVYGDGGAAEEDRATDQFTGQFISWLPRHGICLFQHRQPELGHHPRGRSVDLPVPALSGHGTSRDVGQAGAAGILPPSVPVRCLFQRRHTVRNPCEPRIWQRHGGRAGSLPLCPSAWPASDKAAPRHRQFRDS